MASPRKHWPSSHLSSDHKPPGCIVDFIKGDEGKWVEAIVLWDDGRITAETLKAVEAKPVQGDDPR